MAAYSFPMQLTRGDYLRYFVRHYFWDLWTPWIVSLAVATVCTGLLHEAFRTWWGAGLGFLALFAGTLLSMFALSTLIFGSKLRGMQDGGIVLEPKRIDVDEGGIDVAGSASTAHYDWSQVAWVRPRGRFVFVKLTGADILLLWPARDVPEGMLQAIEGYRAAAAEAVA